MATVVGGGNGDGGLRTAVPATLPRTERTGRPSGPELTQPPLVVRRREEEETVVTFPALVFKEFLAGLSIFCFLLLVSIFVNAPLLAKSNPAVTPNPAKAPWYFLGLQELLERFPPVMAGVAFPTFVIVGMMVTPYIDKNPSRRPQDRKVAISLMTVYVMLAVAFVVIGVFFRGTAFSWDWARILGHPGVEPRT
jgi:menaquinol-cytochrome c reductase cytochrome b/c subunit